MSHITNFIDTPDLAKTCIHECLIEMFNSDNLILNDTRLSIISEVLAHIPFVGGYDQRILPILRDTTVVFSNPFSETTHQYYKSLGLSKNVEVILINNNPEISLTENILQDTEVLASLRARWFKKLINFSINWTVEKLAKAIWAETPITATISETANNKLKLKKFLEIADLPVVEWVYTNSDNTIREYYSKNDHYFFKDPLGVSGYGFWSNQKNSLDEILLGYAWKDIIIEKVIEKENSPSIQFCIYGDIEKKAVIFGFTDQILEWGQHYAWNLSPSQYYTDKKITHEFIRQSEIIINYLIELGYNWFGGIDFMISTDKIIYATEVNARFTWATYPAITSFLLNDSLLTSWRYITREWATESAQEYINISIKQNDEYWVFPLCIAPLEKYGRAQVLFLGNIEDFNI